MSNPNFKDHFSKAAHDYKVYRPHYPQELFAYLAAASREHQWAWDCGTGNGQSAVALSEHYHHVLATDGSAKQIENAIPHARVQYQVCEAEEPCAEPCSIDLVTVAQALHWFDLDRFYAQVHRVAKPGALLAAWCYGLHNISTDVDAVIHRFYSDIVGPYWPPERCMIEEQYASIPFPFDELTTPRFSINAEWRLNDLIGYLGTWSAVQRFKNEQGTDPVQNIQAELSEAWGDSTQTRAVRWPIQIRVGRVNSDT